MPSLRLLLRRALWAPPGTTALRPGLEVLGWVLAWMLIEALGRVGDLGDVYDLGVLLVVVGPLTLAAGLGVARGRLPLTRAVAQAATARARRWIRRLDPHYQVALHLPAERAVRPDRALVRPLAACAALLALAVLLAPWIPAGLEALRRAPLYGVYLLLVALLWAALLAAVTLAVVLGAQHLPLARALLLWLPGLVAAALLPGVALLGAVLAVGLVGAIGFARRRLAPYLFCRRDRRRRLLAVTAQTYFRRLHALSVLMLALVVTLGNAGRLFDPAVISDRHAFTNGIGVLAAVACVVLAVRAHVDFDRLLGAGGRPPETRLVPTVWWQGPTPVPAEVAEAAQEGWRVHALASPPPEGFDLLAGPQAAGPRVLPPLPGRSSAERAFLRRRRLDVVHRREFFRRFSWLVKRTRPRPPRPGGGTLFGPHLWLIPALLRDTGRGVASVGPAYAQVFSPRLRRYLGGWLTDLGVDLVYWEDAVARADLLRVLRVAFECWDQGRCPLSEVHFAGLPRVRVVLHDERHSDPLSASPPALPGKRPQVASGARVLLVLRDRGGDGARNEAAAPSDRLPAPVGS